MHIAPRFARPAKVVAVAGAALALATSPATAAVNTSTGTTSVFISSDAAADTMNVTCFGGQLKVNFGADVKACTEIESITVSGNDGNDSIDLSALTSAELPNLSSVNIDGGGDEDNIKGSFYSDVIDADTADTVQGFGGNDFVTGGDSVFGGDGNDLLKETQHSANGGSGDDRISQPGQGPFDGGEGNDTIDLNFMEVIAPLDVTFTITDAVLRLQVPAGGLDSAIASVSIETYDIVLPPNGTHHWNSSAYTGSSVLVGAPAGDTIVTGPGDDRINTGEGNDTVTAGRGNDVVYGGAGADNVNVRDGRVDKVNCGTGTDTVTADFTDVLVGCETVRLPQPVTSAIKGPRTVKKGTKATFTFSSSTPGAKFQCRLDKKAWKSCKSPLGVATGTLAKGKHVLSVRAVLSGSKDKTPSKKTFTVT